MAYFPNGSSGECFDDQCAKCRFFEMACPIAGVQMEFNYSACDNEVATKILAALVRDDGTCEMFKMNPSVFAQKEAPDA